jgi:hypothetical protein
MNLGLTTDGWKTRIDHWIESADRLLHSLSNNGFVAQHAIPLDRHGELLNGSHRLAASIALEFPEIFITYYQKDAWAPPWDIDWFIAHNCKKEYIASMYTIAKGLRVDG